MELDTLDSQNMRQVILDFPKQLTKGWELAKDIKLDKQFKNVIICGMGGSALPADILLSITKLSVPLMVHKNYGLPYYASKNSLVICISYSGNTEETVSALQEAVEKNISAIVICTGGTLEEIAKENTLPFVKIPSGIQPRSAIGYLFSALCAILANQGIMKNMSAEITEAAKDLPDIIVKMEEHGKQLAEKLEKKIPVIYASEQHKALAEVWKIRFNENTKTPAFYNFFPELNHNEMTGFGTLKQSKVANFYAIILQDEYNHDQIKKRMDLTADILKECGINVSIIESKKGSETAKFFTSVALSDWTSYYLALKNDTDPTPVPMIEDFKKRLA
jgi:glucose/mannose-6-phosphate isomerase